MQNNSNYKYIALITAAAALFYIPFIGQVHLFDWDEINFAESAREMIVTGNYSRVQINYEPFWEKPPLFFWMQVLSMKIFGITEFAARFPNAICGIVSLLTIYAIGKKEKSVKFGLFWVVCFGASILPFFYFKSGIIDPWFNYFIFVSGYFIYTTLKNNSYLSSILGGLFLGLAVITKGPVAILLLLVTLVLFIILNGYLKRLKVAHVLLFTICALLVSCIWFGYETYKNGPWFLNEFIKYQIRLLLTPDSGHGQPFFYHFVVIFLGCFPISIFALPKLFKKEKEKENPDIFLLWNKILFWTVLIIFSAVTTKIIHYSSLCYLPLSYIAATYLYGLSQNKKYPRFALRITFLIVGSILSMAFILIPFVASNPKYILPYIKDDFAKACLKVDVNWSGFEFLLGLFFLLVVIVTFFRIKKRVQQTVYILFFSIAVFLFLYLSAVVPKIEQYSQAPAINFYKSLAGKDVIVTPLGFKSYAHYYYFNKQKPTKPVDINESLIDGKIDKDVFFVTKVTHHELDSAKGIIEIGETGGFKFWYRSSKTK